MFTGMDLNFHSGNCRVKRGIPVVLVNPKLIIRIKFIFGYLYIYIGVWF